MDKHGHSVLVLQLEERADSASGLGENRNEIENVTENSFE